MNPLSKKLRKDIIDRGASLVGFADLRNIPEKIRRGFDYGISIGTAISPEVIRGIEKGPTLAYYEEYIRLNKLLDSLANYAADYLSDNGFTAWPQTTTRVVEDESTWRTPLPHKTVATRAGLGWIGNCALVVTEAYGSAIRITSVLTNAGLTPGTPVNASRCGTCTLCRDACPGLAVKGGIWSPDRDRDTFYDPHSCRRSARQQMAELGLEITLCGKCIFVCPWTQKYLNRPVSTCTRA